MRYFGRGTMLFVKRLGSGADCNPDVAGTSIAFAGEGALARMLRDVLRRGQHPHRAVDHPRWHHCRASHP